MNEIAKKIYEAKENIILLYAFNATGKTRLSVAYKDLTKAKNNNKAAGVYYNAYSEDLFVWNNDEEHDNENIKLTIVKSSLNKYHTNLTEDIILEKLAPYQPKYKFFLTPLKEENPEEGFGSVSFFLADDKTQTPIKISRGEERIFIWCFFLALFEVEGWIEEQNQHFFIDDPVSSLDDHNIFITAHLLLELLRNHCDSRKIIITTHHMGIFTILQDWLKKGDNSASFKTIKTISQETKTEDGKTVIVMKKEETPKYLIRFLESVDGEIKLVGHKRGTHLYHLLLLNLLKDASDNKNLNTYHFVILRQVLESIASFLGEGRFSYVLDILYPDAAKEEVSLKADIINALSHDKVYTQKIEILNEYQKGFMIDVFDRLNRTFHFSL